MSLPEWDAVARVLEDLEAPAGPAENHGLLCGLLCANASSPATEWARHTVGTEDGDGFPPSPLDAVFAETLRQIDDEAMAFELLLPPDDADLPLRARALADWCAGFAFAAGVAGTTGKASADVDEFLHDVTEIARIAGDSGSKGDVEEGAYAELVEYLRVGAMLMRTEMVGRASSG